MIKKPNYVAGQAFTEEQQNIGRAAPSLEGYDAAEYDDDVAQVMQSNTRNVQYLDLSDPSKLARPEGQVAPYPPQQGGYPPQGQYPPQQGGYQQGGYPPQQGQYHQQLPIQESYTEPTPDLYNADAKFEKMTSIMDKVNAVVAETDPDGTSTQKFAIAIALKSLKDTIKTLDEIDYWIPQGKEKYVPQLKQIAAPIMKALRSYTNAIEKLK